MAEDINNTQPGSAFSAFKPYYYLGRGALGGLGAFKGAHMGAQFEHPGIGAAVGGAAGFFAAPALWHGATALGSAEIGIGKSLYNVGKKAYDSVLSKTGGVGVADTASKTFAGAAQMINGVDIPGHPVLSNILSPIRRQWHMLDGFATYEPRGEKFYDAATDSFKNGEGIQLTGKGKAFLLGASVVGGIRSARQTLERSRLGEIEPTIYNAAPRMPQYFQQYQQQAPPAYANNAGATGDLVFALNRNRRG